MEQKIKNVIKFYMLATSLKDKIRTGWKDWNIERNRVESIAEHIYGTCILAIAMESEFEFDINLEKVIIMLTIHELEEIIIGDISPFSNISMEEKRKLGKIAVQQILEDLLKGNDYIKIINEFEECKTLESKFAKMCDKLECDIQSKIYCEENALVLDKKENQVVIEKHKEIKELLEKGEKSISDLFIEYSRNCFTDKQFLEVLDWVKKNDLLNLTKLK